LINHIATHQPQTGIFHADTGVASDAYRPGLLWQLSDLTRFHGRARSKGVTVAAFRTQAVNGAGNGDLRRLGSSAHRLGSLSFRWSTGPAAAVAGDWPRPADLFAAERVLTQLARSGQKVIVATSYGYMDTMLKVAERFPNVVFLHCSGHKRRVNMGTYFGRMYQAS
jgi:ABC transporter substrate-binding protein PnrA-like